MKYTFFRNTYFLFILKLSIVFALFFFLGRQTLTNWEKAKSFKWNPNYLYITFSAIVLFAFNFARGWVWGLIVLLVHKNILITRAIWIWIISSYGRYIPGKIWLFLGKIYLSMEEGVSRKNASVAVMLEFVITVISALLISIIFLPSLPQINLPFNIFYYLIIILIGLLMLHSRCMNFIIQALARLTKREAGPVRYPYWQVLVTVIVFCGIWFWYIFGIFLMFKALTNIPFSSFGLFCCIIPFSMVIGLLAFFAPDGLGVRESILTYGFKNLLPFSIAAILVIIQRLWTTAIDLLTLGCILAINRKGLKQLLLPGKDKILQEKKSKNHKINFFFF